MNIHAEWLTHYGYVGLFAVLMLGIVALPVPEETVLTLSGFLVYEGTFQLLPTAVAGFVGSMCGITVSYTLGRTLGLRAVQRLGHFFQVDAEALPRVCQWFERRGKWLLPVGYFIPGVRHLVALVAGTSGLRLPVFAVFAYAGALVWTQTFIWIGYKFGSQWEQVLSDISRHRWLALAVIAVISLMMWVSRGWQHSR